MKAFFRPGRAIFPMKRTLVSAALAVIAVSVLCVGSFVNKVKAADGDDHDHVRFQSGTLVLSRSVYAGTAATVTVGQTLPPGCVAGTVKVPTLPLSSGKTTNVAVTCATAIANGV